MPLFLLILPEQLIKDKISSFPGRLPSYGSSRCCFLLPLDSNNNNYYSYYHSWYPYFVQALCIYYLI